MRASIPVRRILSSKTCIVFNFLLLTFNLLLIFDDTYPISSPSSIFAARFSVYLHSTSNSSTTITTLSTILPPETQTKVYVNDFHSDASTASLYKRQVYTHTLRDCLSGPTLLCMVLEDDIVFLDPPSTIATIVRNTISYYTNDLMYWDCSKHGYKYLPTGRTGNKAICRIFTKHRLGEFTDCYERTDEPADIAIRTCMNELEIAQGRFLIVQHTGARTRIPKLE
ncbi:hypothetical protein HKX48_007109 [Thoreauomyces humboldtii]|nr:hypothetical protein HKX48_007109 [Thoreauomyces humboldtii]